MGGGETRDRHLVDVGIGAPGIFRRHGVRRQPAGHHPHRPHLAKLARGAQHLQLVGDGQAVARLDLDHHDAFGDQGIEPGQSGRDQGHLVGRPGGLHGRDDTAAGAGHRLVAGALEAQLELARAVAREHQMGVAVDQRRGDQTPAEIGPRPVAMASRQVAGRARPGDPQPVDRHHAVLDQAVGRLALDHPGQPAIGEQPLRHSAPRRRPLLVERRSLSCARQPRASRRLRGGCLQGTTRVDGDGSLEETTPDAHLRRRPPTADRPAAPPTIPASQARPCPASQTRPCQPDHQRASLTGIGVVTTW